MQEKLNEEMLDPEKTRLFSSQSKVVLSKKELKKADNLAKKELKAQKKLEEAEEKARVKEEKRQERLASGEDRLIFRILANITVFVLFF